MKSHTTHYTTNKQKKERKIDKKNIQNTYKGGEKEKNAFISFL